MKRAKFICVILLSATLIFSCKKEKKSDPGPSTPPTPTDTYNPPPAGGGFIMANFTDKGFCWTKDFISFTKYSSKLSNGWLFFSYAGDTIITHKSNSNTISFGNIYNPSDFKTINTAKALNAVSYIHGVVIGYAIDNNNYYIGHCDFRNGQTDMSFTLLPAGVQFAGDFCNVGHAVVSFVSVNNVSLLALSRDGKSWAFKTTAAGFVPHSEFVIRKYNGVFHAIFGSGYFFTTTDTSLVSTSWTQNSGQIQTNTSDSAGIFNCFKYRKEGNNWVGYGYIYNSASGNNIPAKNVSTDNGSTYTTELLTGIPVGKWYSYILTKTHAVVTYFDNSQYRAFISSDFKNFTPYSGSATSVDFSSNYPERYYFE